MSLDRSFNLKRIKDRFPIVQGGMGVGISLSRLAGAVGAAGCVGTISSAALDQLTAKRLGRDRMDLVEATAIEVADTKALGGVAAINIMVALFSSYEGSVHGAVEGGADMIVSGAGLPLNLPTLVKRFTGTNDHDIILVPIISSGRALELMCKKWGRQGYRPDAVVLEGPKAGGHIGWNYQQVKDAGDAFLEEYDLFERLLEPVLDVADKYPNDSGPIPVIVAGGVFTHEDIVAALDKGATAVQMGTRFAATEESDASDEFKQTFISSGKEDIVLATESWGSPCGLPFRYIKTSAVVQKEKKGDYFCICTCLLKGAGIDNSDKLGTKEFPRGCPEKYVLHPSTPCKATGPSTDYSTLTTCGTEAHRVNEIFPVRDVLRELIG